MAEGVIRTANAAVEIADTNNISAPTVHRRLVLYENSGRLFSLAPSSPNDKEKLNVDDCSLYQHFANHIN